MKLYFGPHTCSIGIQAILEEIGAPYESEKVDVQGGATHTEPFKSLNPKERIPVLVRDDGVVMTEYATIARWLAKAYPDKHLVPIDKDTEAHANEMMDYTVGTLHGQAFGRIFFPFRYAKDKAHEPEVKQDGKALAAKAFATLSADLGDHPYAAGAHFSIADTALFYATRWARMFKMELPANIAAHFDRMSARPAFQSALAKEKA